MLLRSCLRYRLRGSL
uniref:Uncharacterized protein n=1 Tax=Arundo donax TaxID=35708 RepID=A0A0A9GG53_ARUDO